MELPEEDALLKLKLSFHILRELTPLNNVSKERVIQENYQCMCKYKIWPS